MTMILELADERNKRMTKELDNNTKDSAPVGYTLSEAFSMMERFVVKKRSHLTQASPQAMNIGVVTGVLTINDEVEIVVKFFDQIQQYTKAEFTRHVSLIESE